MMENAQRSVQFLFDVPKLQEFIISISSRHLRQGRDPLASAFQWLGSKSRDRQLYAQAHELWLTFDDIGPELVYTLGPRQKLTIPLAVIEDIEVVKHGKYEKLLITRAGHRRPLEIPCLQSPDLVCSTVQKLLDDPAVTDMAMLMLDSTLPLPTNYARRSTRATQDDGSFYTSRPPTAPTMKSPRSYGAVRSSPREHHHTTMRQHHITSPREYHAESRHGHDQLRFTEQSSYGFDHHNESDDDGVHHQSYEYPSCHRMTSPLQRGRDSSKAVHKSRTGRVYRSVDYARKPRSEPVEGIDDFYMGPMERAIKSRSTTSSSGSCHEPADLQPCLARVKSYTHSRQPGNEMDVRYSSGRQMQTVHMSLDGVNVRLQSARYQPQDRDVYSSDLQPSPGREARKEASRTHVPETTDRQQSARVRTPDRHHHSNSERSRDDRRTHDNLYSTRSKCITERVQQSPRDVRNRESDKRSWEGRPNPAMDYSRAEEQRKYESKPDERYDEYRTHRRPVMVNTEVQADTSQQPSPRTTSTPRGDKARIGPERRKNELYDQAHQFPDHSIQPHTTQGSERLSGSYTGTLKEIAWTMGQPARTRDCGTSPLRERPASPLSNSRSSNTAENMQPVNSQQSQHQQQQSVAPQSTAPAQAVTVQYAIPVPLPARGHGAPDSALPMQPQSVMQPLQTGHVFVTQASTAQHSAFQQAEDIHAHHAHMSMYQPHYTVQVQPAHVRQPPLTRYEHGMNPGVTYEAQQPAQVQEHQYRYGGNAIADMSPRHRSPDRRPRSPELFERQMSREMHQARAPSGRNAEALSKSVSAPAPTTQPASTAQLARPITSCVSYPANNTHKRAGSIDDFANPLFAQGSVILSLDTNQVRMREPALSSNNNDNSLGFLRSSGGGSQADQTITSSGQAEQGGTVRDTHTAAHQQQLQQSGNQHMQQSPRQQVSHAVDGARVNIRTTPRRSSSPGWSNMHQPINVGGGGNAKATCVQAVESGDAVDDQEWGGFGRSHGRTRTVSDSGSCFTNPMHASTQAKPQDMTAQQRAVVAHQQTQSLPAPAAHSATPDQLPFMGALSMPQVSVSRVPAHSTFKVEQGNTNTANDGAITACAAATTALEAGSSGDTTMQLQQMQMQLMNVAAATKQILAALPSGSMALPGTAKAAASKLPMTSGLNGAAAGGGAAGDVATAKTRSAGSYTSKLHHKSVHAGHGSSKSVVVRNSGHAAGSDAAAGSTRSTSAQRPRSRMY